MDGRTKSGHEDTRGYALIGPIGLNWIVFNCPGSNRIAECWQFMVLNCLENTSIVDIVGVRFVSSCNLFVCVCVFVMFVVGCFITDTHTHGNTSKHISKTTSDILNQAFIRSNLICFWLIRFCFYCLMFYNPSTARNFICIEFSLSVLLLISLIPAFFVVVVVDVIISYVF